MSDAVQPEQFRFFIAVLIPEAVKTEIEKAQAELRRALPAGGVRWAGREQFHLTLKFLGNVEAQRAGALAEAVRKACGTFAALELRAERVGFFPDQRLPRVVWAGVRDRQDRLPELQGVVETAVVDFTRQEPQQNFTGHVTLGRIKRISRGEAAALARAASSMADRLFGEWTADKIEIIRSELSPQGARYTTVAAVSLGGPVRENRSGCPPEKLANPPPAESS